MDAVAKSLLRQNALKCMVGEFLMKAADDEALMKGWHVGLWKGRFHSKLSELQHVLNPDDASVC